MNYNFKVLLKFIVEAVVVFLLSYFFAVQVDESLVIAIVFFNALFLFLGIVIIQMSFSSKAIDASKKTANSLATVVFKLIITLVGFILYIILFYNNNKLEIILAFLLYFIYSIFIYFNVLKLIKHET
ncbi:MAG: hypothetical protein H6553_13620 [Chitinophagales bacterium]|nr:hypothetical protein [Chitinophagales bacterium]